MESDYYSRTGQVQLNGSTLFATDEDRENQASTAAILGRLWNCEFHSWGPWSHVDYYVTRQGNVIANVEVKARSHTLDTYPTVFLNVRKWLALQLLAAGMNVPSVYVVKFADNVIGWVLVDEVDASRFRIGGCSRPVKSYTDVEPVIEVPVSQLKIVTPAQVSSPKF